MTDRKPPHALIEYLGTVNVPDTGSFLVPLCCNRNELLLLLSAAFEYAYRQTDGFNPAVYTPLVQAVNYIDNPTMASCLLTETDDCFSFPPYAPMVSYSPSNPYTDPDYIPPDWLSPPFTIYDGGGSLPPGYLAGDVIVPFSSFTLAPFDVFGGGLPTIKIKTVGSGQIELDMLALPQGGICIMSLNGSPSIIDILNGAYSPDTIIFDTNLDNISFPYEDDVSIQQEFNIDAQPGEINYLFLTFVPIIDDSLIPIRFGGGFRSLQLCGFESVGTVTGITNVRINGCNLEYFLDGQWIDGGSILSCIQGITDPMQDQINTINLTLYQNANERQSLQAQIASNDDDILALQNKDTVQDANLAQNNSLLSDHETRIVSLENNDVIQDANLAQNNSLLSDHETRIVSLENAPSSGGGSLMHVKNSNIVLISPAYNSIPAQWNDVVDASITLDCNGGGLTQVLFGIFARVSGTQNAYQADIRISVDGGAFYSDIQSLLSKDTSSFDYFNVVGLFENLSSGIHTFQLQVYTSSSYISIQNWLTMNVWEIASVEQAAQPTNVVTFDTGGMAYTLPPNQDGTIQSIGNPGNCLAGPTEFPSWIEVEIDLGAIYQINSVFVDYYTEDATAATARLYVEGQSNPTPTPLDTANQWVSGLSIGFQSLPLSGQIIRVRLTHDDYGLIDMRLDNIVIDYQ